MKNKILGLISLFLMSTFTISNAQDIQGSFKGNLSVQGNELPITLNISKSNDDFVTTIDSPAQGATGIATDTTNLGR